MTTKVTLTIPADVKRLAKGITAEDQKHGLSKVSAIPISDLDYYPPIVSNTREFPYCKRGTGLQTSPTRNLGNSEKLSTRWDYSLKGLSTATIENSASYAFAVIGERHAYFHEERGWPNVPNYANDQKTADRLGDVYAREVLKDIL